MRRVAAMATMVLSLAAVVAAAGGFAERFEDRALRIDYVHAGDASHETATLDRVSVEGRWPESRTHLVNGSRLGGYRVRVLDPDSGKLLFERGYDTYFGEYATTAAAGRGVARSYLETVRIPLPRRPVTVRIEKTAAGAAPETLLETVIDPASPDVVREVLTAGVVVVAPESTREIHGAVDIAVLGEGYTAGQETLFRSDLARFKGVLFDQQPYADLRDRVNVWGVLSPSQESGCDEPGRGVWRRTALGASFNSLGSPRYLLTEDTRAVRDAAAHVPYDTIVIMVNHDRYGGGGIYNLYCTFTAHNHWSDYLFLHEFGHSFTGLADEYYTSDVSYTEFYPQGTEPAAPNITALADPANLKWRELVTPGTPIPTPWEREAYDRMEATYQKRRRELNAAIAAAMRGGASDEKVQQLRSEADTLSRRQAAKVERYLAGCRRAGEVGAFEGAGYVPHGLYRPMLDCIMFSKGAKPYCAVCERAVAKMIELRGE